MPRPLTPPLSTDSAPCQPGCGASLKGHGPPPPSPSPPPDGGGASLTVTTWTLLVGWLVGGAEPGGSGWNCATCWFIRGMFYFFLFYLPLPPSPTETAAC